MKNKYKVIFWVLLSISLLIPLSLFVFLLIAVELNLPPLGRIYSYSYHFLMFAAWINLINLWGFFRLPERMEKAIKKKFFNRGYAINEFEKTPYFGFSLYPLALVAIFGILYLWFHLTHQSMLEIYPGILFNFTTSLLMFIMIISEKLHHYQLAKKTDRILDEFVNPAQL